MGGGTSGKPEVAYVRSDSENLVMGFHWSVPFSIEDMVVMYPMYSFLNTFKASGAYCWNVGTCVPAPPAVALDFRKVPADTAV